MCFSAEADFVTGAVITGIGVATLAKVEQPRELALGVLPVAFGLHQLVEGFVWLGLHGSISTGATDVAVHLYLAFAWVVSVLIYMQFAAWRRTHVVLVV